MQRATNTIKRTTTFKRNDKLEKLLSSLNSTLNCAENKLLFNPEKLGSDYPVIFIMGPLRSGTTLFTQWLASTGIAAYPTNLLSRFYEAPVIGAQIQQLLTDPDFNFRDEILDFNHNISFDSENGKTKGALAPNEFWYFWRRFLQFGDLDWLSDKELFESVDKEMLVNELTTLTRVFGKPFALKSMILNYNIPFLNTLFKKAIFIQIQRDPVTNVASILEARKRQLGDEKHWYSFKIPEYSQLKNLDPISQSAGQLHYINSAVTKGMEQVPEHQKIVVQYESFCENPEHFFNELQTKLNNRNILPYSGVKKFAKTRTKVDQRDRIEKALSLFQL